MMKRLVKITHRELCIKASRYLRYQGIVPFSRCNYSVCELEKIGECPDAFGWNTVNTQLIEVKVSRNDFLSDKNKLWRKKPEKGLGNYRSYLCPTDLINVNELPKYWGLLYFDGNTIKVIKKPEYQQSCKPSEVSAITSIMRREGIKPQIFSYKKYNN